MVRVHPSCSRHSACRRSCLEAHLAGAIRRHQRLRAPSRAQRRRGLQVLPARIEGGQKERFLERLDEPEKNWKFRRADVAERKHWDDYMGAYEDVIQHTATPDAPWHIVPADHKWFTRLVVAATVADAMSKLDLKFRSVNLKKRTELEAVRAALHARTG